MTTRRLLLILFLYILLVWILAAYANFGDVKALVSFGLFWTAIGVGALLLVVLLERVFVWLRSRRAQKAAKPPQPSATPTPLSEDDLALLGLIKEADQRLAQAPGDGAVRPKTVLDLPLLLAIGPERAGKTAVIHNSGIEPAMLAGQAIGTTGTFVPTKVANLWLAHESLLVEVSGRIFAGERLAEFLGNLQPSQAKGWKSWLAPRRQPAHLRGILLFFDGREFMGTPEPSKLDRWAQAIRTRLSSIAGVFGAECPVYVLFTNADGLPYFEDFFNGMSEAEAGQVMGVIVDGSDAHAQGRVWAEAETKRLNQLFQSLYLRLSDRRLAALGQETDLSRKPSIYEFPREFRRIRAPLVQFLVDAFKPDPLSPESPLRGVFFTATRKVEQGAAPAPEASQIYLPRGAAPDATQIFAPGGMTQIFRPKGKAGSGRLADRWMFTAEFFQKVLTQDRPAVRPIPVRSKAGKNWEIAAAIAAALAMLVVLAWTVSWIGNWSLVSQVKSAIQDVQSSSNDMSVSNLQALDRLREQLEQLQRENPWHLHWGLFTGNDLRESATKAYFARLKQLSLDRINQTLAAELRQSGSAEQQVDAATVYDRLKTHQTIAARTCPVEQPLVRRVLIDTVPQAHRGLGETQRSLLDTQIGFYVSQLAANKNLPLRLAVDQAGVENARAFVRQQNGLDQRLRGMLSEIGGQVKPLQVPPEYKAVLSTPTEFPGVFTKQGQLIFEDRVARDNFGSEERCVMGESAGQRVAQQLDTGARDRLRSLYYREYADAWRDFLTATNVLRYASLDDAVQKLNILSDSRSPLLGIVRMAAENTNFQLPKAGELNWWEKAAQTAGLGGLLQQGAASEKSATSKLNQLLSNDAPLMTPADVATLFQPVVITTPPSDLLVNANDKDYVEGLRKLTQALDGLAKASTAERAGALAGANAALAQANAAHTALSDKFPDVGKEGLNKIVSDLLLKPISFAGALIPANMEVSSGARKNGDLKQMCREIAPSLLKYPFNPNADGDISMNDVERIFAPTKGIVWQYVQKSASDLIVLKDTGWEQKPDLQGLKVAPELLTFLNRAQDLRKTFFTESGVQRTRYVLRRVPNQTIGVQLILDGQELSPQEGLQKTFFWPAAPGVTPGAAGNVVAKDGTSFGFGRFDDPWGVFRLFQNADERPLKKREVQWSQIRGRGGASFQPINPPAKVEVVEFPGDVDLFNPKFFDDLKCPGRAVLLSQ